MNSVSRQLPDAFTPWSSAHCTALIVIAVAAAALTIALRRSAASPHYRVIRGAVCWCLASVLVLGATDGQLERLTSGRWTVQESLPLDLCDIGVFVTAAALLAARRPGNPGRVGQRLYELAYVWGIGGTTQAVLTPDLDALCPSRGCIRYFLLHGTIIVSVLTLTVGLGLQPQHGAFWRVWLTTALLAAVVLGIDRMLGANYMYLLGPPANPSIYDFFGPWPWSLLSLTTVGTLLIALCCLPFWIRERRASRRSASAHPPA